MSTRPPLQLLLLRDDRDHDLRLFEEAIERAFVGGVNAAGYLASGEDLGIELRRFNAPPDPSLPSTIVDAACHSLFVALIGNSVLHDAAYIGFLESAWRSVKGTSAHTLLILCPNESNRDELLRLAPRLQDNSIVSIEALGERALRPTLTALLVLHTARLLLARVIEASTPGVSGFLTLFISHAKLDGLPLAQSLKFHIETIPWLRSFYDARDLFAVGNWEAALEKAATTSMLVILRTDAYEHRVWCQKEALWAEEMAAPTVLVEARPGLSYPAGELPLERMPSVRIPDGNLFRILNAALRESIRYLLFQRRVRELIDVGVISATSKVISFSYPPSMSALLRACDLIKTHRALIIYPDPPLRRGVSEAAIALVASRAPNATLTTPMGLAAGV